MLTFLNKLNPSKATGLEKISARMPCLPISNIFNCSLTTGFPNNWKWAKVTPLIKQGRSNNVNNQRPISVISVVASKFERITYHQLIFLNISKSQSGFPFIHSPVTALLEATYSWAFNIDRGNIKQLDYQPELSTSRQLVNKAQPS